MRGSLTIGARAGASLGSSNHPGWEQGSPDVWMRDPFCFAELFSSSQSRLGERKLGREGTADRG